MSTPQKRSKKEADAQQGRRVFISIIAALVILMIVAFIGYSQL
ncbi:MAG: hypothetical protein Q4D66_03745 [Bacteroidales bacterium]|nr:hypothetical protein [Bacteroidales bacterium]